MNKIYLVLILALVSFFSYGLFTKKETNPLKKEKRVSCQASTITFEKFNKNTNPNEAINLLQSGNYTINSHIEFSKYMKSQILQHLNIDQANELLKQTIKKYSKEQIDLDKKLQIKYYIYENDKEDKGKKGTKCKLYAGYLVFEFILDKKQIYKIQTDYMKMDTSDIPERLDCVINSFITLKKD